MFEHPKTRKRILGRPKIALKIEILGRIYFKFVVSQIEKYENAIIFSFDILFELVGHQTGQMIENQTYNRLRQVNQPIQYSLNLKVAKKLGIQFSKDVLEGSFYRYPR